MIIKEDKELVLVIMEDNENLVENLTTIKEKLSHIPFMSVISALGMLKQTKMGYWNGSGYEQHFVEEPVELLGISGLITPKTDPFFHFHITVGKKDGNVAGGHLLEAHVCNTLELVLIKSNIEVKRVKMGNLKYLRLKEV